MEMISGFLVGFLGSAHCAGMCGPIALVLPVPHTPPWKRFVGRLLYNLGRLVTYGILGLALGLFGKALALAGLQQVLAIVSGCLILLTVFLPAVAKRLSARFSTFATVSAAVQRLMTALLQRSALPALFWIGVVNGLLPCGFVYVALAGAAVTGDPMLGSIFMVGFGLGTVPILFGISVVGTAARPGFRKRFSALVPVLAIVFALIIILRGLNLGIPYLSPSLPASPGSGEVHRH